MTGASEERYDASIAGVLNCYGRGASPGDYRRNASLGPSWPPVAPVALPPEPGAPPIDCAASARVPWSVKDGEAAVPRVIAPALASDTAPPPPPSATRKNDRLNRRSDVPTLRRARKQSRRKYQPIKQAAIDAFGRRRKRQVNHREAIQIPPIPARICNGTPGFPRYFAMNRGGRRS